MPVSHARDTAMTSTDGQMAGEVPGLLEVLARVPGPRKRRGRRYLLVFVLAVAVACTLAGAKNFREVGDQAADLPQDILMRVGGRPHPLLRRITAPSETRIRTLVHAIGADLLDEVTGGWLRALADAGWAVSEVLSPAGLPLGAGVMTGVCTAVAAAVMVREWWSPRWSPGPVACTASRSC